MSNDVVMIMVSDRRLAHGGYHVAHLLAEVSIGGARSLARAVRVLAFNELPYPVDLRTAGIVRLADLPSWAQRHGAYVDVSGLAPRPDAPPFLPSVVITSRTNPEVYERLASEILSRLKDEHTAVSEAGTAGGDHGR